MLGNEEFDNLKEELLWEGSKVAILRSASAWLNACMAFWAPAHFQQRVGFINIMNNSGPARRKCGAGMAAWRCCLSKEWVHHHLAKPVVAAQSCLQQAQLKAQHATILGVLDGGAAACWLWGAIVLRAEAGLALMCSYRLSPVSYPALQLD